MPTTKPQQWTKSTVYHYKVTDLAGGERLPLPGYLSGNVAIFRDPERTNYTIVHYPSGKPFCASPRLRDAKQIVAEMRTMFPNADQWLDGLANDEIGPYDKVIKQFRIWIRAKANWGKRR